MTQVVFDTEHAKQECENMRKCFDKYGINNPKDIYNLSDDPTQDETQEVFRRIMLRLAEGRDGPTKINYLVIFFFSGHGMLHDG